MKNQLHFKRYNIKYVCEISKVDLALEEIGRHIAYDINCQNSKHKFYHANSIYFDTDNFKLYTDKLTPTETKRLFRIRWYNDISNSNSIFIEIKRKKSGDMFKKVREEVPISMLDTILNTDYNFLNKLSDKKVVDEILNIKKVNHNILPKAIISFKRTCFEETCENYLRLTCDKDLKAAKYDVSFRNNNINIDLISSQYSIIEIKSSAKKENEFPDWLISIIRKYNFLNCQFSKYCMAIEKLYLT